MMHLASEISAVICAYTEARWDGLIEAVRSVQGQRTKPREIVIVVDHNPVLKARTTAEVPGILVVENAGARGLSSARNSGIHAANGAVAAFLDDDAMAAPDWLAQLAAQYANPRVAGVGGATAPPYSWRGLSTLQHFPIRRRPG